MIEDRGIENFCANIKNLRIEKNLTKKEMAKLLGIGVHSLLMIEGGNLPPRLDCMVLYHIHQHFGIKPAELFRADFKYAETKRLFKTVSISSTEPEGVCDTPSGSGDGKQ